MSPFLIYIARAGLYLSLFYAFYLMVMRRTTFFRLNRTLLLSGSYLCLLLPFIRLRSVRAASTAAELTMVAVGAESEGVAAPVAFPWHEILLGVYITGVLVTLTLYGISAWKMVRLIRKGEKTNREGCRLIILEEDISSFSWGQTIVMGRKDSLDLLFLLPIQLLFWWNPLVWITREELRLLHEYEADEGVIQKGIDAKSYQLLLVRKAVGDERFSMASGFQHAKLSSRITMMLKPSSSAWKSWSYLALIPVLAVLMYACNAPKENLEPDEPSATAFRVISSSPRWEPGKQQGEAVPVTYIFPVIFQLR